ncbi:MAG: glycosyltransferase family 2 protein, partial [Fibrobacterota bacterium]
MQKGLVSIVIVNWNGKRFLNECLNSIFAQTYKNNEIVFVDNGSEDGSVEYIRGAFPLITKLAVLDKNYGYAYANNEGMKLCEGEFIALVNNDLVLKEDWLEKVVDSFNKHDDMVGSLATKIIQYHKRKLIDSIGIEYLPFGAFADYKGINVNSNQANQECFTFAACAAAAVYRKRMLVTIGGFESKYFAYFEDSELSFRAQLFGYKCFYEPSAISYHIGSGTGNKNSSFYVYHGRKNIEYLFFTNMQGYLLLKYLPIHFTYEVLNLIYFTSIGKGLSFLKAKVIFLINIKYVIKRRSE